MALPECYINPSPAENTNFNPPAGARIYLLHTLFELFLCGAFILLLELLFSVYYSWGWGRNLSFEPLNKNTCMHRMFKEGEAIWHARAKVLKRVGGLKVTASVVHPDPN